ncbi:probable G-protein coupled receptor 82 isoform X2 [Alosa sapidissima]|uniref:probable G-protein coupled receptor 82 isoform X2 n=1 Tax=Alosa sapidissima TaxID=34773 RepID=UPI001C0A355F|nr:probable G-protein coupled receptor 82 isoform X2 [Alosa sapidissima]
MTMADANLTTDFSNVTIRLCPSVTTYIVLPTLYTLMFLAGLPGNILSLWVFMSKIPDKSPTHIYLINLSVSNLVLCLTMPILAAYYALSSFLDISHPFCKMAVSLLTPIIHTNITVGMINLTWVALSRCATLILNNHAHRPNRVTKVLPSAFLHQFLVLAGLVPFVVMYSMEVSQTPLREKCYSVRVEVGSGGSVIVGSLVISFLSYLLVLSSYIALSRHIQRIRHNTAMSNQQHVYARVFRNIMVILVVLSICLLPHQIWKVVFLQLVHQYSDSASLEANSCHPLSVHVEVKNVLISLAALRCSADPITYFLLDRTFRKHTVSMLGLTPPSNSQSSGSLLDHNGAASQVSKVHNFSQVKTENRMMMQCTET